MPTVRLLAISNLVAPAESEDTLILKGAYQDKKTLAWVSVENEAVPSNMVIAAGSLFEAYLDDSHLQFWLSRGHANLPGDTRHFDLEEVFSTGVTFMGEKTTLADVLRVHLITNLEDVVANRPGQAIAGLGTSSEVPAQDILRIYGDEKQVSKWLEESSSIIGGKV